MSEAPRLPKVRWRDVMAEAVVGVLQRPARSAMTAFGTVLGIGVLIVVLGLTTSASAQISSRFDPLTAVEVAVTSGDRPGDRRGLPADAPERALKLDGTVTAGFGYRLDSIAGMVSRSLDAGRALPVMAVSPGYVKGSGVTLKAGVTISEWHQQTAQRVALLGPQTARQLGYTSHNTGTAIWIDGVRFAVLGVIDDVEAHADLLTSVIIPESTARQLYAERSHTEATLVVTTRMGAAQVVADQLPIALDPRFPELILVEAPAPISSLRDAVTSDLDTLLLLLGAVCLVVGMVSIANTTFVAVIERTPEIGLRRAIGARPSHVMSQFLLESTLLGVLGGLVGASVGILTVVGVCAAKQWTAVLDWRLAIGGPALGAIVGALAGLLPAWRAARIEPIEALRQ